MDAENEGVENYGGVTMNSEALPPDWKVYNLCNPPTINYNDKRSNQRTMVCSNPIIGTRDLHNVSMAYVNDVNAINTFVEPTPPTNIITNYTILTQ